MRRDEIAALAMVLISLIIGIYFYDRMPERMASHWNIRGEVDGYSSKTSVLFLMPSISVGAFLLFIAIPKIDPLMHNIDTFRKCYDGFVVLTMILLSYLYLSTIFWNIGVRFNMLSAPAPAFGVLFYYVGVLCQNAKRNWFIGIRTPWTLSNDRVWEKTHQLGAKLFKLAGIIPFLGIILQEYALFFVLAPVIVVSIYVTAYSYFEYRKIT